MLSTKSGAGKLFCSVVCKQLLWEAPVVFLRRSRARLSLRRYTGDLGRSGGSRAGPAARSRRAAGGVRGRTGLGRQRGYSRCSLHIALVPLFQRYLLDLFGLLRLPPLCKCHEDESVGGEGPQWKDVWRRDLSARATWESRSGRSLCAKNRNSAEQQGNDKIRKSGVEQGAGGVCGEAMVPLSRGTDADPEQSAEERAGDSGTCGAATGSRGMCSCRDIAKSKSSSWLQEHMR